MGYAIFSYLVKIESLFSMNARLKLSIIKSSTKREHSSEAVMLNIIEKRAVATTNTTIT